MPEEFSTAPVDEVIQSCPFRKKRPEYWIEIELVGEDGKPIAGEMYVVALPDGTAVTGYLDSEGWARIENIESSADCQVSFPGLDAEAWKPHQSSPLGPKGSTAPG
jgi:hypothetical protein